MFTQGPTKIELKKSRTSKKKILKNIYIFKDIKIFQNIFSRTNEIMIFERNNFFKEQHL